MSDTPRTDAERFEYLIGRYKLQIYRMLTQEPLMGRLDGDEPRNRIRAAIDAAMTECGK